MNAAGVVALILYWVALGLAIWAALGAYFAAKRVPGDEKSNVTYADLARLDLWMKEMLSRMDITQFRRYGIFALASAFLATVASTLTIVFPA